MSLDPAAVKKIARLSRIRVAEADLPHYAKELSGILAFVEQLNELDTNGVPQMVSVADIRLPMRQDVVTDGNQPEAVLKNAPASAHGCFEVPKVIE